MSVSGAKNKNSSLASSSLMGMVSSLKVKKYSEQEWKNILQKSTGTVVRINTSVEDMGSWAFRSPDEFYR